MFVFICNQQIIKLNTNTQFQVLNTRPARRPAQVFGDCEALELRGVRRHLRTRILKRNCGLTEIYYPITNIYLCVEWVFMLIVFGENFRGALLTNCSYIFVC